jgi:hypothetical protein
MKLQIIKPVFVMMALLISASVLGQSEKNSRGHLELEADPIAYFLKGYSFHAGYQKNSFRYDAGLFGIELPKSFSKNHDFIERSKSFGFKADYVGAKAKGWFVGAETDYTSVSATYKITSQKKDGNELGIGIRGGYRFLFGKSSNENKGFYITPWIGIDKIITTSRIVFHETEYKPQGIRIFPTVHAGWRF